MVSTVYFADFHSHNTKSNKISRIGSLLEKECFRNSISKSDLVAVKCHFGERGNDSFVRPIFIRRVVDWIEKMGGNPFLTDTNTLYCGGRANAVDHLKTALRHGFGYEVTGAPIIIADGLKGGGFVEIHLGGKHFSKVKIGKNIDAADSMVVVSHFKGHQMAGFGGAIKNLAMGCAPIEGKKEQHSPRPRVNSDLCTGCGACLKVCPADAITIDDGVSRIDVHKCIGCGSCIAACPSKAINLDWETDTKDFLERLSEYAYGAVKEKPGKVIYINFLMSITPDCDCASWSDRYIVPDIGILASVDPVAIDRASFDLVNAQSGIEESKLSSGIEKGGDKFKGIGHGLGEIQLQHAESLGLGTNNYKLEKI